MQYWLMKSEPNAFSIDDLKKCNVDHWDGVRNYQVRNMLRDQMQVGDLAFFYHSNCQPPGISGTMEVVKSGYPDFTAWDEQSDHFDPKSTEDKPRWYMVDVKFKSKFDHFISLAELKEHPELHDLAILRKGNRLSIVPVTKKQWQIILAMQE